MVYVILAILGLCGGSFVSALTWRIREKSGTKNKKRIKELSMLKGRSMCPNCNHTLAWYDLVPLFSWLSLKGKCRYCKKPISWQYPLMEAFTAIAFVISYAFWPQAAHGLGLFDLTIWSIVLIGLIALLVYDLRWQLLPNTIVYPLFSIAITWRLVDFIFSHNKGDFIIGVASGVLIGGGIFYVLFQISKGKWIGGGDVKLGGLLGLIVGGPSHSLLLLFFASLLGCFVAVPGMLTRKFKTNSRIAFGPFLVIAAFIIQLFGASILAWYKHKFLLIS